MNKRILTHNTKRILTSLAITGALVGLPATGHASSTVAALSRRGTTCCAPARFAAFGSPGRIFEPCGFSFESPSHVASTYAATYTCFKFTLSCAKGRAVNAVQLDPASAAEGIAPDLLAAQPAQDPSAQAASQQDQSQTDQQQQQRDRDQQARDREQEKRDAEQARLDRQQELYDRGREALDEARYARAEKSFTELSQLKGKQADAALYWLAYVENRQGKRDAALATISQLKSSYPQSRWRKDAEALEIEMRQNSGRPVNPDSQSDEDLKVLALQGIMNNDPAKGIPMVERYLASTADPKDKSKALFLLVQSGSAQAQETLAKIARGQSNPELQRKAVEYLGMTGGKTSGKLLGEIYSSTSDPDVKRSVLRSYMISGDRDDLVAIAKTETNPDLKRDAIRQIGLLGGKVELQSLYQSENSPEIKKDIIQALFLSGDSARLSQLALSEKNPELRKAAIRNLGLLGAKDPSLQSIYDKETDRSVKEEVLNAYFIGGNASGLVAIAKSEKDPELKKAAVSKLALMNSKEGNEYLMELLKK
jgi:HEAT repeats